MDLDTRERDFCVTQSILRQRTRSHGQSTLAVTRHCRVTHMHPVQTAWSGLLRGEMKSLEISGSAHRAHPQPM